MTADPLFSVLPMGALEHPRVEVSGPVCVVVPAAGVGERMNLLRPKQFCDVVGRPLISYTIESFEKLGPLMNNVNNHNNNNDHIIANWLVQWDLSCVRATV